MLEQHLQAIITVLSLVNPFICGAMFAQMEGDKASHSARMADATRVALAVLIILTVAALVGTRILHVFGISLEAFSIAGGGVLAWIGFSMLSGAQQSQSVARPDAAQQQSFTRVILFAASPGTITGVITIAVAHTKLALPITALVAIVIATLAMWIAMVLMARGGPSARGGLFHDTMTRFMGLIVLAMGVQFGLTGFREFFAVRP